MKLLSLWENEQLFNTFVKLNNQQQIDWLIDNLRYSQDHTVFELLKEAKNQQHVFKEYQQVLIAEYSYKLLPLLNKLSPHAIGIAIKTHKTASEVFDYLISKAIRVDTKMIEYLITNIEYPGYVIEGIVRWCKNNRIRFSNQTLFKLYTNRIGMVGYSYGENGNETHLTKVPMSSDLVMKIALRIINAVQYDTQHLYISVFLNTYFNGVEIPTRIINAMLNSKNLDTQIMRYVIKNRTFTISKQDGYNILNNTRNIIDSMYFDPEVHEILINSIFPNISPVIFKKLMRYAKAIYRYHTSR